MEKLKKNTVLKLPPSFVEIAAKLKTVKNRTFWKINK